MMGPSIAGEIVDSKSNHTSTKAFEIITFLVMCFWGDLSRQAPSLDLWEGLEIALVVVMPPMVPN